MKDEVVEKNDVGDTARSGKESLRKCETVRDRRHGPDVSPVPTSVVIIIFGIVVKIGQIHITTLTNPHNNFDKSM